MHFADSEKVDEPEEEDLRLIRAFISTEHDDINPALADLVRRHEAVFMSLIIAAYPNILQDQAEPGTIARRTRSQMPLEEVSLEELECKDIISACRWHSDSTAILQTAESLVPEQDVALEVNADQDDEYNTFLRGIFEVDSPWVFDEEDDAEYDYMADQEKVSSCSFPSFSSRCCS